jgi:hypothetical protein
VKLLVYSVFDRVRYSYSPLQLFENEDAARRAFTDLVNDPQSIIAKSPVDFVFDCIGQFDVTTGEIEQHEDLDFSAERIKAVDVWKEPKDDKITILMNKIRRLESQLVSIQDQLDGGNLDE